MPRNPEEDPLSPEELDDFECNMRQPDPIAPVEGGCGKCLYCTDFGDPSLCRGYATAPVEASGSERDHRFVPGVMRCAKCNFVVVRRVFSAIDGTVGDGDNKTEPCPNGCGPLWPMTWEQNSRDMEERCEAAVLEAANLRAQLALRPQPSGETRGGSEGRWRDRALSAEASMEAIRRIEDAKAFGALSATDVACYRYPGEDQQALRGAFVDGVMSQSAWSVWLRGPDEVVAAKSYADAVEYCDRLNAEAPLVRAVPMPVGVTLRPAPVAETAGEAHEARAIRLQAALDAAIAADDGLARAAAAEAQLDRLVDYLAGHLNGLRLGRKEAVDTVIVNLTKLIEAQATTPPVPAQDDDKLRNLVRALERCSQLFSLLRNELAKQNPDEPSGERRRLIREGWATIDQALAETPSSKV